MTNWPVVQQVLRVLGFDIDIQRMRMKLPERKREILQVMRRWPSARKTATARDVEFDRKVVSWAKVVRPGRFFVWRLLLMVGLEGQQETGDTQLAAV